MVRTSRGGGVDLHSSTLHCITDHDCLVDVSCENTSLKSTNNEHPRFIIASKNLGVRIGGQNNRERDLEPKVAGVAMVDAFLNRVDPDHGQDRAKWLLPGDPHVRPDMIQQQRPDEVAFSPVLLAKSCPFLLGINYQAFNEICRGFCYNWGDITIILWWAYFQLCQLGIDLLYDGVGHRFHDQNHFDCSAPLATVVITSS